MINLFALLFLKNKLIHNHFRCRPDGTEHVFTLRGVGESPLALGHIKLECKSRESISHTVTVPNYAQSKLVYKVFSDIPFLDGDSTVTVLKVSMDIYKSGRKLGDNKYF